MTTKNRKRHQKSVKFCSFCGSELKNGYSVLNPGVFTCPECTKNIGAFLSECGGGEYGYKTTSGRSGVFTVGTF